MIVNPWNKNIEGWNQKKNQLKKLKNKAPTKRSEVVNIMQVEPKGQ